jgi:glycosyltransferase involved in cell wall biosynthesis
MQLGGYSKNHPFIRFLQWVEDKAYRESDSVISNLRNSVEHMQVRGMDPVKFTWVPTGFSMAELTQREPLDTQTSSQLPRDKFVVGYTGTFGIANALSPLLGAAELLKDQDDVVFVLVGSGKEKPTLQRRAEEKGLENVVFIDPIPKAQIQSMLQYFDVCFIGWMNESLYQYGIGANKLPEYLFSGKPVLHAFSGACDPVAEAKSGLTVSAEDSVAIADAVMELKDLPKAERDAMGARGRAYAIEKHEYGELAGKLSQIISSTLKKAQKRC